MKSFIAALLLLSGSIPSLFAQDIHSAPPVWINCDETPDELPVPRGIPSMTITDELKKVHEPVYVEYRLSVSEKGKAWVWGVGSTSPWMPNELRHPDKDFVPAKRKGKSVASEVALHLIFNPAEADPKSPDAIPRLLAVQPPIFPGNFKHDQEKDPVVRVKISVNENGIVVASQATGGSPVAFAEAAAGAVRGWQFAPARKGGQPVAAELEVNVVFQEPLCRSSGVDFVQTKPLHMLTPAYPVYLKRAGISGEVDVSFVVNAEGRVTDVAAANSTHPGFEDSAIETIKEWRFAPASIHGQPVSVACVQRFLFSPDDNGHDQFMGFKVTPPKSFPKDLPEQFQFDVVPKLEHMALPVYPLEDLKAKRGGVVTLAYVIGPDGRVQQVKAMPGAPSASLAAAAVAALEQYRFTPPGRKGQPCYAMLRMELEFSPGGQTGHVPVSDRTKRILRILEKTPEKLAKASALDRRPQLRIGKPPEPSPANAARGDVMVEFVLDSDGIPQLPHVISADDPALGYAACQAIADWRFNRPQSAGKYVDVIVRAPVKFQ